MAFGSSGSKSSSNSNTNSSTNQTQTSAPTNPSWVTGGLEGITNQVAGLSSLNPSSLVPGANTQQLSAADNLSNLGIGNIDMNAAAQRLTTTMNNNAPTVSDGGGAQQIQPLISQFMNPNIQSVVNPSLAAFDYGAGQTEAQQRLSQAGTDSAFGGSGAALAEAATRSQTALQRGQLAAGLYGNAYDEGMSGAASQANLNESAAQRAMAASIAQAQADEQQRAMKVNAATSLANIGLGTDQNTRANIATQQDVGNNLYGIQQNQAQAPVSLAGNLASIWSQLPLNLLHGETDNLNGASTGNTNGSSTSMNAGFKLG